MTLRTSAVAVCCCKPLVVAKQSRVLDGDDRLRSEIFNQLGLLGCERANLLAVDTYDADKALILEHGHQQKSSAA